MSIDTVVLALAKKYTDAKVESGTDYVWKKIG